MSALPAIALIALIAGVVFFATRPRSRSAPPQSAWDIGPTIKGENYSKGYGQPTPLGAGCEFDFEVGQYNHVHYLTRPCGPLAGSLRIEFEVAGNAVFRELGGSPARVVPYFAHGKNDWQSEHLRWWAKDFITEPLTEGRVVMTVPLAWQHWSNVYGGQDQAAFVTALLNAGRFGLTFGGGNHYGHGVWADKPATFKLHKFEAVG